MIKRIYVSIQNIQKLKNQHTTQFKLSKLLVYVASGTKTVSKIATIYSNYEPWLLWGLDETLQLIQGYH